MAKRKRKQRKPASGPVGAPGVTPGTPADGSSASSGRPDGGGPPESAEAVLERAAGAPLEGEAPAEDVPAVPAPPEPGVGSKATPTPVLRESLTRCPYCHEDLPAGGGVALETCSSCAAAHHAKCWALHEGCATCAPRREPRGSTAPDPKREGAAKGVLASAIAAFKEEFRRPLSVAILLTLLTAIFYANSFEVPFLFDDAPVITRNRLLWSWEHWDELATQMPVNRYLTNLTFLFNFQLAHGGVAPMMPYTIHDWWSYHLVSIVLHAANGVLLFLLLRGLLRARPGEVPARLVPWVAMGGAAVWLLHPANTMAVSYIAQRYALMAGLAFLGTLVLYVRLRLRMERTGEGFGDVLPSLAATLLAAVACAFTKENATVVPLAILGIEAAFFRGRYLKQASLFLLILGLAVAVRAGIYGGLESVIPTKSPASDRWEYLITQVAVVPRYLHLFLVPHDLTVEQSFPILWSNALGDWALKGAKDMFLLGLAAHGLLIALAVKLVLRGHRFIPLAIGWFYLTNVVESSIIPILDPMVDHRMYLPTALLPAAFGVAFARAWPDLAARWPRMRDAVPVALVALVLACGAGTAMRNAVWASPTGIWKDTIEKRPDCARAYSSLGMEHLYEGDWLGAVGPIEAALWLGPYHVEGWNNLGKAYLELERWEEAERALLRGIEVHRVAPSPSVPLCWNNVGLVYIQMARRAADPARQRELLLEASRRLQEAARLDPGYEVAYLNLANSEFDLIRRAQTEEEKVRHARTVVEAINRAHAVARSRGGQLTLVSYRMQGLAQAEAGAFDEAFQLLKQLAAANPRYAETLAQDGARVAVAAKRAQAPEADELLAVAAATLEQGIKAAPGSAVLLVARGQVADAQGNREVAAHYYQLGLKADPNHPEAAWVRGRLGAMQRDASVPAPPGPSGPLGPQGPAGP